MARVTRAAGITRATSRTVLQAMATVLLSEGRKTLAIAPDGEGGLNIGLVTVKPLTRKAKAKGTGTIEAPHTPGIVPPDGRSFVDGLTDDERAGLAAVKRAFAVGVRNGWTGR